MLVTWLLVCFFLFQLDHSAKISSRMGCMEGTCGAITGAVAVIGAIKSCGDIEKPVSKAATYKLSGELVKRFQEKNQATKCKDLKGIETGKVLRSCPGCIEDATAILEEILAE